jgi:undecaprenyl-diphosphatase
VNSLDYFRAIILGVIQGLTEFLPISSSGHLAIVQDWFALPPDSPEMLLFDVSVHLGTVIAVVVVFAREIAAYARRLVVEISPTAKGRRHAWRFALLGVAASLPTAVIGLMFKDSFERAFADQQIIGVCLGITAGLLWSTTLVRRGRRGWRTFGIPRAVIVGVAQGLAILPGISRSGSTICTASLLGLRRRWAGEFSFFIAVPAICGAALLKLRDTYALPPDEISALPWGPILVGALVSLIVGVFALIALLRIVRRARLHLFAPYCLILGITMILGVW